MKHIKEYLPGYVDKLREMKELQIRKIMFAMKVGLDGVTDKEDWRTRAEDIYIVDDVIV